MKDKLIALLKTLGILTDDKAESLSKELDKLGLDKNQDPVIDSSKISDPALKQVIETLNNQVAILGNQNKTLLDTLNAERTEREKAVKLTQDQAKADSLKKVDALVEQALKDGKISKAKESWLKDLATTKYELAESWVKDAPVEKGFKPEKKDDQGGAPAAAKPTSMRAYMDNRAENTASLIAELSPNKN
jgi:hypothetical protein